jgi:hypothetical protein
MMVKPTDSIDKLKEFLKKEKINAFRQINDMIIRNEKYNLPEDVDEILKVIAKEIIKNGYFDIDKQDKKFQKKLMPVIDIFCEKEILFFDPQTGIITPNSRIYLKAMEKLKKEEG